MRHHRSISALIAAPIPRPGQAADPAALNDYLGTHGFAKWQCPERYEVIDAVPRTSTGKFWKLKLREKFPK